MTAEFGSRGGAAAAVELTGGVVNDATYATAAGRAATDGDEAIDTTNLRRYTRIDGLWSFTQLYQTISSLTLNPIMTNGGPFASLGEPITYTFASPVQAGQFVNGDWWVVPLGDTPIVVTSMTPDFDGVRHGYQVNPPSAPYGVGQSFHADGYDFHAPPELPLEISPGDSLCKVQSHPDSYDYPVLFAAVVTCLDGPPPANCLRPPFTGDKKPLVSVSDMDIDTFADLPATDHAPTFQWCLDRIKGFRLNFNANGIDGPHYIPTDACDSGKSWGGDLFSNDVQMLAALQLDHLTRQEKRTLAMHYCQQALDVWAAADQYEGDPAFWRGDGGQNQGMLVTIAFAAAVLGDGGQRIRDWVADGLTSVYSFWETGNVYKSQAPLALGLALWGQPDEYIDQYSADGITTYGPDGPFPYSPSRESLYWEQLRRPILANGIFNGTSTDPYQLIDGSGDPGQSYMGPTSDSLSVLAAVFDHFPQLKAAFPTVDDERMEGVGDFSHPADAIHQYGHRYAAIGIWTSPDDAAPKIDTMVTYGTNYGPDGLEETDEYIKDPRFASDPTAAGRWPERHGTVITNGSRKTVFGQEFWDAYAQRPFFGVDAYPFEMFDGPDAVIGAPWDEHFSTDDAGIMVRIGEGVRIESFGIGSIFNTTLIHDADSTFQFELTSVPLIGGDPDTPSAEYVWKFFCRVDGIEPLTGVSVGWDPVADAYGIGESLAGVNTAHGGFIAGPPPAPGDQIALAMDGPTATLYIQSRGVGPWNRLGSVTDLTVLGDGGIGFYTNDSAYVFDNVKSDKIAADPFATPNVINSFAGSGALPSPWTALYGGAPTLSRLGNGLGNGAALWHDALFPTPFDADGMFSFKVGVPELDQPWTFYTRATVTGGQATGVGVGVVSDSGIFKWRIFDLEDDAVTGVTLAPSAAAINAGDQILVRLDGTRVRLYRLKVGETQYRLILTRTGTAVDQDGGVAFVTPSAVLRVTDLQTDLA